MTASIVSSPARIAGRTLRRPLHRVRAAGPQGPRRVGPRQARVGHPRRHRPLFMALSAANGAIATWIIANAPDATVPEPASMVPLDNFLAAVGVADLRRSSRSSRSMSLLVAERERGTLSWVASKPVVARCDLGRPSGRPPPRSSRSSPASCRWP